MLTANEYYKKMKRKDYAELLIEKNRLLSFINAYEEGIPENNTLWKQTPDPDEIYIHDLKYLSKISALMSEKYVTVLSKRIKAKSRNMNY